MNSTTNIYQTDSFFGIVDAATTHAVMLDDALYPIAYERPFPVRMSVFWSSIPGTMDGDRVELAFKRLVPPCSGKLERIAGIIEELTHFMSDLYLYAHMAPLYPAQRITIYIGNTMILVSGAPSEYGAQILGRGEVALARQIKAFQQHLQTERQEEQNHSGEARRVHLAQE